MAGEWINNMYVPRIAQTIHEAKQRKKKEADEDEERAELKEHRAFEKKKRTREEQLMDAVPVEDEAAILKTKMSAEKKGAEWDAANIEESKNIGLQLKREEQARAKRDSQLFAKQQRKTAMTEMFGAMLTSIPLAERIGKEAGIVPEGGTIKQTDQGFLVTEYDENGKPVLMPYTPEYIQAYGEINGIDWNATFKKGFEEVQAIAGKTRSAIVETYARMERELARIEMSATKTRLYYADKAEGKTDEEAAMRLFDDTGAKVPLISPEEAAAQRDATETSYKLMLENIKNEGKATIAVTAGLYPGSQSKLMDWAQNTFLFQPEFNERMPRDNGNKQNAKSLLDMYTTGGAMGPTSGAAKRSVSFESEPSQPKIVPGIIPDYMGAMQ